MPIHNVETPDGQIIKVEAPEGASQNDILAFAQQNYKPRTAATTQAQAPEGEERSWLRAATDPLAGFVSGVGNVLQLPGKFQELALGKVSPEALAALKSETGITGNVLSTIGRQTGITGLQGIGKTVGDFGESLISPQYKQFEQLASAKSEKAGEEAGGGIKGFAAELYTVLKEVATNPSMFPTFLAKQAPQMAGPLAGGKITQAGTKMLFKDMGEKTLASIGVGGAVGTGAIMQGTDVGYDAFEDTFKKLVAKGVPEEKAYEQALEVGKDAFLGAAAVSVATQMLPGGRSLERSVLSGKPIKPTGYVRPVLGESGTEFLEESGGKVASNIAQQRYLPETDTLKGAGTQGGFGAAGGFGAGVASGVISKARTPSTTKEATFLNQEPPTRDEADITAQQSPELLATLQPAMITSSSGPVTVSYPNPNAGQPMPPLDGTTEETPVDYRGFPEPPVDLPLGVEPASAKPAPEPDTSKIFPAIERDIEGADLPNVTFDESSGNSNAIAQEMRSVADSLGVTPLIYKKMQEGKSVKQTAMQLNSKLAFLPAEARLNFVTQIYNTLGLGQETQTTNAVEPQTTQQQGEQPGAVQGPTLPRINIGESPTDMVNQVAQTMRRQADQKGLTTYIADQSAKGRSAKQIANSFGFSPKLDFIEPDLRHNFVRQVQATLGYGPIAQRWGVNVNQPTITAADRSRARTPSQPARIDTTTEPAVVDESGVGGVDSTPADIATRATAEPPTLTERPAPRETIPTQTEAPPTDVISDLGLTPPTATPTVGIPRPAVVINALVDGMNKGLSGIKDPAVRELLRDKYLVDRKGLTPKGVRFLNDLNGKVTDPIYGIERAPTNEEAQKSFDDMFSPEDMGPAHETIKARSGVENKRLVKMMGQKLYGDLKTIAPVTVKEMLQNSFDAIKTLLDNGQTEAGSIDIKVDPVSRTISIHDDGSGMLPETLAGPFLRIAGTEKETDRSSGGFGIAKMQFLHGNEGIKVYTMRDGKISVLETTGEVLKNAMDDPSLQPDITVYDQDDVEYLTKMFPQGHGTYVEVKIPENYFDSSDQSYKEIPLPDSEYDYEAVRKSPLFAPIKVKFNGSTVYGVGDKFPANDFMPFTQGHIKFKWGTAKLYVSKEPQDYIYKNLRVLSNGIWQFDGAIKEDPKELFGKEIPYQFYLDISPTVKPEDIGYPFSLERQGFNKAAQDDLNKVLNYVSIYYQQRSATKSAFNFGNIAYYTSDAGGLNATPTSDLAPKPKKQAEIEAKINKGDTVSVNDKGELVVNGKIVPMINAEDIKNLKVETSDLKVDQSLVDASKVILHDNLEVLIDKPVGGEATYRSIVELAREKFGPRFDEYIYGVGDYFKELRDVVAKEMGYHKLNQEGIGVSFDNEYRGVSIRLPFSGSFVNPAVPEYTDTPARAAVGMIGTMVHELAHHEVRSHNASFPAEMQRILINLDTSEDFNFQEFKEDFIRHVAEYKDVLDYLNEVIKNADTRPIGNKFSDSSNEARDAGASTDVAYDGIKERREPTISKQAGAGSGAAQQQQVGAGVSATSRRAGQKQPVSLYANNSAYNPANQGPQAVDAARIKSAAQSETFFSRLARKYVNFRYPVRRMQNALELAGKAVWSGKDINVTNTLLTAAGAMGQNYYRGVLAAPIDALNSAIGDYASAANLSTNKALENLHLVAEAKHEPERRLIKWLLTVPLSTAKTLTQNGQAVSPADRRQTIIDTINRNQLTTTQVKGLRAELDSIVANYQDALGYSPRREGKFGGITGPMNTDMDSDIYRVTSLDAADIARVMSEYNADPHKDKVDAALTLVKDINARTLALNQLSNYVSDPVINRIEFYGWNDYVPLKGYDAVSPFDEELDFTNGKRMSRELQEQTHSFDGRETPSHNPIMQTVIEAVKSAGRAGRGSDTTLSIKNLVLQGHIPGTVSKPIPFENRDEEIQDAAKKNAVFHYNKDGSVEVIRINDQTMLEAIRRTYEDTSWVNSVANKITSAIGKGHTRYNYTFAPFNFARDVLTNAMAIGSDMGPIALAKFVSMAAARTVGNFPTAVKVAYMYESNDMAGLKALTAKDGFAKDMVEYIANGGMQSYTQSMTIGNKVKELDQLLRRGGVAKTRAQVSKVLDVYNNMFELVSRTAAYGVVKSRYESEGMTSADAAKRAAMYVKDLANFEQFGENGRAVASWFMFFRPAATGAARAIEATIPAFTPMSVAVKRLPHSIKSDPEAVAEFKRNYNKKRLYSAITTAGAMGLGYYVYGLAAASAPDDELGRNSVKTDNMDQWVRNARFPIPKELTRSLGIQKDVVFQIPWGFGQGAFASAGAQIAAANAGQISTAHAMKNIFLQIAFDSYVPLPISRMDPVKDPLAFAIDSVTPNVARPLLEFALNKNGLGHDINPNQQSKFGSAYRGSEFVPEMYKDAARWFADVTGIHDVSPNSLYFFANNYLDGIAKLVEGAYGLVNTDSSKLPFDPRKDTLIFGSFFGNKASVDNREFAEMRETMDNLTRKTKMFMTNPQKSMEYVANLPIIDMWNKDINGTLKKLQTEAQAIKDNQSLNREQRHTLLKNNSDMQSLLKYTLLEKYKAMGVFKPQ